MATVMKTPGVYVIEKDAFPGSVVEVATAVPAFIGYTEKAEDKQRSLIGDPTRITSLTEFERYFGKGPSPSFSLSTKRPTDAEQYPKAAVPRGPESPVFKQDKQDYFLRREDQRFFLYQSLLSFYQNGGGPCFIVSVGTYLDSAGKPATPDGQQLKDGIATLVKEQEPTLLVLPDAVLLGVDDCIAVQQEALKHCGELQSRFSILDVHGGYVAKDPSLDPIEDFRDKLGVNELKYGAAYYPWIDTTIVQENQLSYENLDRTSRGTLMAVLLAELKGGAQQAGEKAPAEGEGKKAGEKKETPVANDPKTVLVTQLADPALDGDKPEQLSQRATLNKGLFATSEIFKDLIKAMRTEVNRLPPSGTMAGVYTAVDNSRGVWKAPANVSLNGVIRPTVKISHKDQEDLNVTPQGKSVNAIRSFVGEGTLVWGARTLDGNSLDWRYISVRRTMIMLEESIKLATKAYVFEANDANTWVTIKSMIRNFLTGIWKRGGLAGASPDDAFSVHVGLGETMTPEDILEGILRVTVLVAPTRPAEFIELTFQQQMQKS